MNFFPAAPPGDVSTVNLFLAPPVPVTPGVLPYDPLQWGLRGFEFTDDGGVVGPTEPKPTCTDAGCVFVNMPDGTKFRVIQRTVPDSANPLASFQLTDSSDGGRLGEARPTYPT